MPLPPRIGETISPTTVQPASSMKPRTFSTAFFRSAGVPDNAAFADGRPARLELRLDQSHQPGPGRGELQSRRERQRQADEADIGDDRRHLLADHLPVERPRVGAFQGHHPRIHPELGVKLAAADIDRIDFGGSACDQHVGEAAGRGADIERYRTLRVEAEGIERGCELLLRRGRRSGSRRGSGGARHRPPPARPASAR